jgi:Zn-dependent protease with chaperone function
MASAPLIRSLVVIFACAIALPSVYSSTAAAETPSNLPARNTDFDASKLANRSTLAQCEYPHFWSHEIPNSPTAQRITKSEGADFSQGAPYSEIAVVETLKRREGVGPSILGSPMPSQQTVSLFLTITRYFEAHGYHAPGNLTIVHSGTPNAFARKRREVVLTDSLVARVTDRSELAFVLAHEVAHVALGHGIHGGIAAEVAADALALQVVTALGFNPCSGPSVLERLGTPSQLTLVSVTPRLHALYNQTSSMCG